MYIVLRSYREGVFVIGFAEAHDSQPVDKSVEIFYDSLTLQLCGVKFLRLD